MDTIVDTTNYFQKPVPDDEVIHERVHRISDKPQESIYDDPSAKIWSIYLSEADRHDKALAQGWSDEMDSILIFVSDDLAYL
jgi:Family of unknown function (DUF6535)